MDGMRYKGTRVVGLTIKLVDIFLSKPPQINRFITHNPILHKY